MVKNVEQWAAERQFQRFLCSVAITVRRNTGPAIPAVSLEISEAGMSMILPADLQIGERIDLDFDLPPARLRVAAVVRHKSTSRYGMEFLDLSGEEREQIRNACASLPLYTGETSS